MPRTLATERQKKAAIDRGLRSMFLRLELRGPSARLIDVIDQLEASERPALKRAG